MLLPLYKRFEDIYINDFLKSFRNKATTTQEVTKCPGAQFHTIQLDGIDFICTVKPRVS